MIRRLRLDDTPAVEKIFWETSVKKTFEMEAAKTKFLNRYLGYYLHSARALNFVAEMDHQVVGYILCVPDTREENELLQMAPLLNQFSELYADYPAHLHINMDPQVHSQGLGSQLVHELETHLKKMQVRGLHLLTGVDARNRKFYEKNGFLFHHVKNDVLFMGKALEY